MPPPRPPAAAFPPHHRLDSDNEVVCPLHNQDGSGCRKRCLGEKRYRSMQEHIRRAHPEYYLPKLPATKDSFELMINTPPHEITSDPNHANHRQHPPVSHYHHHSSAPSSYHHHHHQHHRTPPDRPLNRSLSGYPAVDDRHHRRDDAVYYPDSAIYSHMHPPPPPTRESDGYRRGSLIPAVSAAAALAQLQHHRPGPSDWTAGGGGEGGDSTGGSGSGGGGAGGSAHDMGQNYYPDHNADLKPNHFHVDPALDDATFLPASRFPASSAAAAPPTLMPSSLAASPPDRENALPPPTRSAARPHNRPRKASLTQHARVAKHERKKSRDVVRRSGGDKKAVSVEPSAAQLYGKRWEDLIDAAASATEEEGSRDLTPMPASPYQSPQAHCRTSLPPFSLGSQFQSFQASPLNRALTPPPPESGAIDLQPFPSVESSVSSNTSHHHHHSSSTGSHFQIMHPNALSTPSESSPLFATSNPPPIITTAASASASTSVSTIPAPASASSSPTHHVQIYCAGCRRLNTLVDAFACTHCICGLCAECVHAIVSGQSRGRMSMCPRCNAMDSRFKQFQLDLR